MKSFIAYFFFSNLAKLVLKIHKPYIIAITGSVGKTITKDYISDVLKRNNLFKKHKKHVLDISKESDILSSKKSFNSEFGVLFTILDISPNVRHLTSIILAALKAISQVCNFNYSNILILEIGIDGPKDMERTLKIITPDITVLTQFSDIPSHCGNFLNINDVYTNKLKLALAAKELVIYNEDDIHQLDRIGGIKVKKIGFSLKKELDGIRVLDISPNLQNGVPLGINVKLFIEKKEYTFFIPDRLGKAAVLNILPAIVIGKYFNVSMDIIRIAVASLLVQEGRMKIETLTRNIILINDSYNASPISTINSISAIESFDDIEDRVLVMGELAEFGESEFAAWESIFSYAENRIKEIIVYKPSISLEKLLKNYKSSLTISKFYSKENISEYLYKITKKSRKFVIIKGSRRSKMEKVRDLLDKLIRERE